MGAGDVAPVGTRPVGEDGRNWDQFGENTGRRDE